MLFGYYLISDVSSDSLFRRVKSEHVSNLPVPIKYSYFTSFEKVTSLTHELITRLGMLQVSTEWRSVDFALKALDSNAALTVEAGTNLHRSLAKFTGDAVLSPLQMVFRKVDLLPWDLSDVLSDLTQQDLDGRRRAVSYTNVTGSATLGGDGHA